MRRARRRLLPGHNAQRDVPQQPLRPASEHWSASRLGDEASGPVPGVAHDQPRRSLSTTLCVPLWAGGSSASGSANLFPQPAAPRPGFVEKDRLENAMHNHVDDGQALRPLQRRVAKDWVALYRDLVSSARGAAAAIG